MTQRGPKSTPRDQHRLTGAQNRLPESKIVKFNPEGLRSTSKRTNNSYRPNSTPRHLKSSARGLKSTTKPQIWRPKTNFQGTKMESYRPESTPTGPKTDSHFHKIDCQSPKSIPRAQNCFPEAQNRLPKAKNLLPWAQNQFSYAHNRIPEA